VHVGNHQAGVLGVPTSRLPALRLKACLIAFAVLVLATCAGPAPAISPPTSGDVSATTPTIVVTLAPTPGATLPPLSISNTTTLVVTVVVNGEPVATVAPGVLIDPVSAVVLPPLPWAVEARSPGGRVLVSMTVHAGDVRIGASSAQGDGARIDLSCGRLDIWAGPPMIGPPPGPGTPGDCAP
jgi:hypothetical protein